MKITDGAVIELIYELHIVEEGESDLVESTNEQEPMRFIFHEDPMLPSFEQKMSELSEGDLFDFVIAMDDAYGAYSDERIAEFPKTDFMVDGELDDEMLTEGALVPMKDPDGQEYDAYVIENKVNSVVLDFNHPLAGGDLHFKGKVHKVEWPKHLNN